MSLVDRIRHMRIKQLIKHNESLFKKINSIDEEIDRLKRVRECGYDYIRLNHTKIDEIEIKLKR